MQTPWIRFSAEVVFEERQDIRDAIIEKSAIVNALYKTMRDNPIFKVFYLKDIDGGMTRQMIYHGDHGWTLTSSKAGL